MKLLYLMNDFKGTLKANYMNEILKEKFYSYDSFSIPFSDGGDGLTSTFEALLKGNYKRRFIDIRNPLNEKTLKAYYLVSGENCYIESASFIGYKLLDELDVYHASSYGLGQALLDVLNNQEIKHIYLGLGGSCTNDLGAGVLQALGVKFFDDKENEINVCGNNLVKIKRCDFSSLDKRIEDVDITILSDVKNHLLGKDGATYVYAIQKGARKEDLPFLESGIRNLSNLCDEYTNKDMKDVEGSGAAGGLGFLFLTFFNSRITSGAKFILDSIEIKKEIKESSLIFTGEGRLDQSSFSGKGSIEIIKKVKEINPKAKIVLLCGSCQKEAEESIYNEYENVLVISCVDDVFKYDKSLRKQMAVNIFEKTIDLNISSIKEMLK